MEISVREMSGVPEHSILSVRAGAIRRQGPLAPNKPMRFAMSPGEACPFVVDLFAPLASSRLTLKPDGGNYDVPFAPLQGFSPPGGTIELKLGVTAIPSEDASKPTRSASRQNTRLKHVSQAQEYIEKHSLAKYVQNLMQSLLKERPDDPWLYMKRHLDAQRVEEGYGPPPAPMPAAAPAAKPPTAAKKEESTIKAPQPLERDFEGPAFSVCKPDGTIGEIRPVKAIDIIDPSSTLRRMKILSLGDLFPSKNVQSPLMEVTANFQTENSWVSQTYFTTGARTYFQMCRAGPRKLLHFDPKEVTAAIVTCGGLCPGLNSVIREIVLMLDMYGANKIFGICGGYKGVTDPMGWLELTAEGVEDIHNQGGTMLVSDRGNPPVEDMAKSLIEMGVNQYYVVGGDGTHRGAYATFEALSSMGHECAVVGVPKTIDNDVPMLDRTFGFDTACTEAIKAINSAYVEATCNANCIGMVKLMGRHCGFIAMNACLAARFVDICLLPEMEISLPKVLKYCLDTMQKKGHMVVVVAEGCGDTLVKSSGEKDAGGNVKLADVGTWLRDKLLARFKEVKLPLTIKYIDPTYMVRAVKPNSNDSVYSSVLAQNAVHAAMAGDTGVTVGRVQQRYVMLPMQAITQQKAKRVDLTGRPFARLVSATLQPDFTPDGTEKPEASAVDKHAVEPAIIECTHQVDILNNLNSGDEIRRMELEHLSTRFGAKEVETTLDETIQGANIGFVESNHWVTQTLGNRAPNVSGTVKLQMLASGPRRSIYFQPDKVAAAIVTCGGLCPGLNSVIREIVFMLYSYGVQKVYGIKGGWKGVTMPKSWLTLSPENCKDIHNRGGSILVADRGNPTPEEMAEALKSRGVQQFYVIGGDGTHRCAQVTYEAMGKIGWECAVVGVPKTIDNDIAVLDRTFGFDTAVTEATRSLDTAFVEATCNGNCIGLVRLMGRDSGYLTMMSVLAARQVDICLLPEMDITLEKVLEHCVYLVNNQGYAVVVVAEGCGDTLLQSSGDVDAGGNKKLADVGPWLKDKILARFKELKRPLTIKYVDPTYTVRAIPANPNDSVYCSVLAAGAVHGAMAGYTGMTVAKVDEAFVYLPIGAITNTPNRRVDLKDRWYERLLATTQQPNLGATGAAIAKPVNPLKDNVHERMIKRRASAAIRLGPEDITVPDTKITIVEGFGGEVVTRRKLERNDILRDEDLIRKLQCFHLSERFGSASGVPTTMRSKGDRIVFHDNFSWVTQAMTFGSRLESGRPGDPYYQMIHAGPRETLHFDPKDPHAAAAIVSCGGICPGLNSVIREIVMSLWAYGVRTIYGIKGGYKGVVEPESWMFLTPDVVADIHTLGGTILVSDRGNPPPAEMAQVLKSKNVRQYFVLGGDGTHKGAMVSFEACLEIDHECSVVGVPKTIDNDVPILDQTFGFDTACCEAVNAVDSAYVEATCNANCIGLVKLMGRHCGFIAMYACLAARHADICLLPEMNISVEKVLEQAVHLMKTQKHAVIVVAEGCGDTLIQGSGEVDAGGNKKLADAGLWLKSAITKRFKELGLPLTIKYIDPTYMIRSLPANAFDSTYCARLAQNAVHAAMAGYSGVTVGKVSERYVYLPINAITMQKGRRVNPNGRWFARLVETTRQPDFRPDGVVTAAGSGADASVMFNLSLPASINDVLKAGDEVRRLELVNLADSFTSAMLPNPAPGCKNQRVLVAADAWSCKTFKRINKQDDRGEPIYQMLRSGPRSKIHFNPERCGAVIVTCGGICPGLNSVIREIVMTLVGYGVTRVYGCRGGYKGMVAPEEWMELTPSVVQDIHLSGGSILVSDRGNPPPPEIAKCMQIQKITQCFVLGGDGTHRGAMEMFKSMQAIGHECAVVGVPKTIDNDIPILDRSFGFKTASMEAKKAIDAARTEAMCNTNCISLVKLMGRHCGFIAMEATLAARHVDVCLLPEMQLSLPKLLTHSLHLIRTKGHAVIVVAEGCGDTLIQSSGDTDAGGNKKLADVGTWLKETFENFFKKMMVPMNLRYFDPTYMIRAVPANPNDSVLCSVLGQQAVHGAMAGYSGFTVGKVDERYVMLPIHAITTTPPRRVEPMSAEFRSLINGTGQPNLAPGVGDEWALMEPFPDPEIKTYEGDVERPYAEIDILEWKGLSRQDTASVPDEPQTELLSCTLKVIDGAGGMKEERSLRVGDVTSGAFKKLMVLHLGDRYGQKSLPSPLQGKLSTPFRDSDSFATEACSTNERVDAGKGHPFYQVVKAGPQEYIHFNPKDAKSCAAIIAVGCCCPGENAAIREIVMTFYRYGVERVFGIPHGFKGVVDRSSWMQLDPEGVRDIHEKGGCILTVQRGNPPHDEVAAALKEANVRQLVVLGGDGGMKGTLQVLTALTEINHECACIGIPATIDNDIPLMDGTFGFSTACTVAREAIDAAYVEATCNANCIGFVKVDGNQSGFLALHTTLSSRVVDICLLPEMEIDLNKVLAHCEKLMETKKYAVVVCAKGAQEPLFRSLGSRPEQSDVGIWLKDRILAHFKEKRKPLTIKYIDPTYMVQTAKPNASDSVYTATLAEAAVHGAMSGYTGAAVGKLYNSIVLIPIQAISRTPHRTVNMRGRWIARMLATTQQPFLEPDGFMYQSSGSGQEAMGLLSTHLNLASVLRPGSTIQRMECTNLSASFPSRSVPSPLEGSTIASVCGPSKAFMEADAWTTQTFVRDNSADNAGQTYLQMMRSGPRKVLHFDPKEPGSAAAIVTCGGLCPGLNSVIRELANMLHLYGVEKVYGIRGGYKGCVKDDEWIELTPSVIQDIHAKGGSILVADRGNPPVSEIAQALQRRNIRQYFVLGGDGTHAGAAATFTAMTELGHECAVVGVPKTIDNDIQIIDRSFGFDTACTEAKRAIDSAYVEATTNANCVGLVKLMGRHCGWIALQATLAARYVDVCLIPEMNISLPKLLDYICSVMMRKKWAVIVVAEGCGDTIIQSDAGTDAGGNKVLADVGIFMRDQITSCCKSRHIPITVKYIDPTYMIRSVPPNAQDSELCSLLAQQAVHVAMAGFTGITVGKVDERFVTLPIHSITSKGQRKVDLDSSSFERLMGTTLQPRFDP